MGKAVSVCCALLVALCAVSAFAQATDRVVVTVKRRVTSGGNTTIVHDRIELTDDIEQMKKDLADKEEQISKTASQ